jgi:hypothetical protein
MKIRTSILLDIGYNNQEVENLEIEISESFSEYTNFNIKEDDERFEHKLAVPNNKLREFVQAINEHIKIHGL